MELEDEKVNYSLQWIDELMKNCLLYEVKEANKKKL